MRTKTICQLPFAIPLAFLAGLVLFGEGRAYAQQVVVTDVTYEHSATTTSDSHYRLDPSPETPADLTSPVDYASGAAHVRLEVFSKPSEEGTRFQICFEARPTYACTNQAPTYTTTGIYTWATAFSSFYQGDMVDWSMGTGRIALILKDTMNLKPSPENVGEETSALFMPTMIRVTVTLVAPGGTYVDPTIVEDAGVTEPDAGPPVMADTGTMPMPDSGSATPPTVDSGTAGMAADTGATPDDVAGGCSVSLARPGGMSFLGAIGVLAMLLAGYRRSRARRR